MIIIIAAELRTAKRPVQAIVGKVQTTQRHLREQAPSIARPIVGKNFIDHASGVANSHRVGV
jgi:hypothetical protein